MKNKKYEYPYNLIINIIGEDKLENYKEKTKDFNLIEIIENLYSTLTEREVKILKLRYKEYNTLNFVGSTIGITGARVRQIEMRALRRCRHISRLRILYGITDKIEKEQKQPIKFSFLEELDLSNKTFNSLRRAGFWDIEDFQGKTDKDFLKVRNFGNVALTELKEKLKLKNIVI